MKAKLNGNGCVPKIERLNEVSDLIQRSIHTIANESIEGPNLTDSRPSWALYKAQRSIISATGVLVELVSDPSMRLMEYSGQYWESRALAIAVAKRFPDLLASSPHGLSLQEIAKKTCIDEGKLGRVLRCLCSSHIFQEIAPDTFSNNRISSALIDNEPLRSYILMFHADLFSCAEHLPHILFDKEWGPSYDVRKTAFQSALGTSQSRWEWLQDEFSYKEEAPVSALTNYPGIPGQSKADGNTEKGPGRPELTLFNMAMMGGGRVTTWSHVEDYPWGELKYATIVDVGGGVGGFMLELSKKFPCLNLVIQDCEANVEMAKNSVWPKEDPVAINQGRVHFMTHDFFKPNPVHGADVYWLRYILHDWADSYCLEILSALRKAMRPRSRLLICEQVMDTTAADPSIKSAPSPLLANYGVHRRYSHQRDLDVMAIINGIERTPAQFDSLFRRAGLVLDKIWPCRSQVSILEARLPS